MDADSVAGMVGDILRLVAVLIFMAFALTYSWRTNWDRTVFGRHMMQSTVSHIMVLSLASGYIVLNVDYPFEAYLRVFVMCFVIWVAISRFVVFFRAQNKNLEPPPAAPPKTTETKDDKESSVR